MFTRRSLALAAAFLFGTGVTVAPSFAQHGNHMGAGDDSHQQDQHGGVTEHMGDMHSGEMMEHMSGMMNHMSQMVGDMHEYHEQFAAVGQHQQHMSGAGGDHDAMMHAVANSMEEMLPHMDGMLQHMRSFMEKPHDEHMGKPMEALVEHMDTMLQAGRDVMATLHGISSKRPGKAPEGDHSAHNH
jgi:hypothetical protein